MNGIIKNHLMTSWYTTNEIARFLDVSRIRVHQIAKRHNWHAIKWGHLNLWLIQDVDEYLQKRSENEQPADNEEIQD